MIQGAITRIDESFLSALLSFSADPRVYVGVTHLLPQCEAEQKISILYEIMRFVSSLLDVQDHREKIREIRRGPRG